MPAVALLAALLFTKPPQDNFARTWTSIADAIESNYYARKSRRGEMERLLAKYKPIASAARDRAEFDKDVNAMIAEFKDSHFAFYTDADQGFFTMDSVSRGSGARSMPNIGAYFRATPQGYVVQMLLEGSPAQSADLRKGDVVTAANGAPFQPVGSFASGQTVDLTVLRGGNTLHASVRPEASSVDRMFLDATRKSIQVLSDNGRKIGYIHVWMLANDRFREALASAVESDFTKTDAVILDLRDGFGGRPEGFADPFFRPEMSIDWNSPNGSNHEEFGYQRPLIVLINGGSRSAKEVLSLILKKSHRAKLVGSRTAGNVLGTSPMRIGDWGFLEIPMVDVVTDGARLEGHGVEPDVPVAEEFDANGKDLYLAKALELLREVPVRL